MDPKATLERILDAWRDLDVDEFDDACEDLLAWIRRGGFVPKLTPGMVDSKGLIFLRREAGAVYRFAIRSRTKNAPRLVGEHECYEIVEYASSGAAVWHSDLGV